jgi:hypothetical protein
MADEGRWDGGWRGMDGIFGDAVTVEGLCRRCHRPRIQDWELRAVLVVWDALSPCTNAGARDAWNVTR